MVDIKTRKTYNMNIARVGSTNAENDNGLIPLSCSNMYMHKKAAAESKKTVVSIKNINDSISRHWESMPEEARKFILEKMDTLSIHKLAKFWSRPSVRQYTVGGIAGSVCGASWFIASQYLKLGHVREAKALTLNGAFLHQCFNMPIEDIIDLCGPNFDGPIQDYEVRLFSKGYYAIRSLDTMVEYLKNCLPDEYQHMMNSFTNISSPDNIMNYVGSIGADWSGSSSPKSQQRSSSKTSDSIKIKIILVDDTNEDERHSFDIGSSTTLKTVFNEYAEKRSVSLRSLRFSYAGKTLFLSTVGNRTPEEMQMRDRDVINVHDTNTSSSQESSNNSSNETNKSSSSKKSKSSPSKSSSKKNKGKNKNKKNQVTKEQHPIYSSTLSLDEYKAQHSKVLSKLHEECQSRLKDIRMRLNALDLERQPPKQKKRNKRKNKSKVGFVDFQVLTTNPGVGGKAGKPFFPVQVGEVQNLYKTTKPSILSSRSSSSNTPVLDLHGCTKEEALVKLDDSLNVWVDVAQRGNYPFVMSAEIVCGCGNQILSETVQEWIKTSRNVCNTPKNLISRN